MGSFDFSLFLPMQVPASGNEYNELGSGTRELCAILVYPCEMNILCMSEFLLDLSCSLEVHATSSSRIVPALQGSCGIPRVQPEVPDRTCPSRYEVLELMYQ